MAVRSCAVSALAARLPPPSMLDKRTALMMMPLSLVLSGGQATFAAGPAQASSAGEVLKGLILKAQRADGGAMITAPLKVALRRLDEAKAALGGGATGSADTVGSGGQQTGTVSAIKLVRASSLNCYLFEPLPDDDSDTRASLVTQQMHLADPCTFRLIVKNVTDFSNPEVKSRGTELVKTIILDYSKLDNALTDLMQEGSVLQEGSRERAAEQLEVTTRAVRALKDFVEDLLARN